MVLNSIFYLYQFIKHLNHFVIHLNFRYLMIPIFIHLKQIVLIFNFIRLILQDRITKVKIMQGLQN